MRFLAILTLVAACSPSSEGNSGPTTCAKRAGTYLVSYAERSGTCGPQPDQLLFIDAQDQAQTPKPPCTGSSSNSADNCSVTVDLTCPNPVDGGPPMSGNLKGIVRWDAAGSMGGGTFVESVTRGDGAALCSSTYAVKYARQ